MPREQQYFFNRPSLRQPYVSAARAVAALGCRKVGLRLGIDDWEYPLWVLLGGPARVRFEHVGVSNISANIPRQAGDAVDDLCAIIATDGRRVEGEWARVVEYPIAGAASPLTVSLR